MKRNFEPDYFYTDTEVYSCLESITITVCFLSQATLIKISKLNQSLSGPFSFGVFSKHVGQSLP